MASYVKGGFHRVSSYLIAKLVAAVLLGFLFGSTARGTIGQPAIQVFKQVVCNTNICEPFSTNLTNDQHSVVGISSSLQCPAFCYRVIVTNTGNLPLTSVTVSDNSIDLSSCFPTPFTLAPAGQPNSSAACIVTLIGHCVNTTNIVTASGVGVVDTNNVIVTSHDTNTVTVVPISVACQARVTTNNGLSFVASPAQLPLGTPYVVRIVVTNTGSYALQNVVLTSTGFSPLCFNTTNIGSLGVNASATLDCGGFTCAASGSNDYAVFVSAQPSQALGHICAYDTNGFPISATSSCDAPVTCGTPAPKLCVTKQIACFMPSNQCGTFGNVAAGVASPTQKPAFCYFITVTNCGPAGLTNVSIVDDQYGALTADFPCLSAGVFAPGQGCSFTFTAEIPAGTNATINLLTNTVTASGGSVLDGQNASAVSSAVAVVIPASISCAKNYTIDGGPLTNNATITDQNPHTVVWYLTLTNSGVANLENVTVSNPTDLGCADGPFGPFELDAGASVTFAICTNASFICTTGLVNNVQAVASQFTYGTNRVPLCTGPSNVTVHCESSATIICCPPPMITCSSNIVQPADPGMCGAIVSWPAPAVTSTCPATVSCEPPSGSFFPIGNTTVCCSVVNDAGKSNHCCFTVDVTTCNKCPLTLGFWKNHANAWPVSSLTIGGTAYPKDALLLILGSSTKTDATLILGRNLVAAMLNTASCGSDPRPICNTIQQANLLLQAHPIGSNVKPSSQVGQQMVALADLLDKYNNGFLTGHCVPR